MFFSFFRNCPDPLERKNIKTILKEGRKARQDSAEAQASSQKIGNVNDICWFCHVDVTSLEKNKCAGCRKVTPPCCPPILRPYVQARYCAEKCQRSDWGRHGDYCVKVQEKIRKKIEAKQNIG